MILAARGPVLLAPSMNVHMLANPIVQANIEGLRALGYHIIDPGVGYLACGYEGAGRLAEPPDIVAEIERAVGPRDLAGERVLVTAGPNREPIDPVRFISNRSTGKMGYAMAAAAWRRGADVVLISGPTALPPPHGVRCARVTTAAEMRDAVMREFEAATMILMAAAVADYRPARVAAQKLKKTGGPLLIECERTADILGELAPRKGDRYLVGFAAETEDVVANARRKLREKRLDMIVANDVSRAETGFEADTNAVAILDRRGRCDVPLTTKEAVADAILDRILAVRRSRRVAGESAAAPPRKVAPKRRRPR